MTIPFINLLSNPAWWKSWVTPSGFSYDQIPDLTGKVAIVTGANAGLGYATMVGMAARGAHVFLACRSEERAMVAIKQARAEIQASHPSVDPKLDFLALNLEDLAGCHKAAQQFLATGLPLHVLVNNAGIMGIGMPFALTNDGIEQQFAVNYLGHFVFTLTLLDRIKQSAPSRIVLLSSMGHETSVPSGIDFDTLNDKTTSDEWTRYSRSKLAMIFFGQELARRLSHEKVYINIAHPGWVLTELQRSWLAGVSDTAAWFIRSIGGMFAKAREAALTQLYLATSPEVEEKNLRGKYFIPVAYELRPHPITKDMALQTRLWEYSEKLMQDKIKV